MSTLFPTALDSFTNPTGSQPTNTPSVLHHQQHSDINDAVKALEAKVGINGSAVTSSLDYKLSHLSTDSVAEGVSNLYFTNARAVAAAPVQSVAGLVGNVSGGGLKSALALNNVENTALSTWGGSGNLTTLGTIATGVWQGTTIAVAQGGTGQVTAGAAFNALAPVTTLGDLIYASGNNASARLAGNTAATRKFLRQTGTGAVSAVPAWDTLLAADVPGSALTKTDDTNVTLALGGTPTIALLAAASLTLGWSGQLAIARGGTGSATANDAFNAFAPAQSSNSGKYLTTDGTNTSWGAVAVPQAANPAGLIGMTAANGIATTFERSDATHAIDPAITPTWTGKHTWQILTAAPQSVFCGWSFTSNNNAGGTSTGSGCIQLGNNANWSGRISYEQSNTTTLYIDNAYNNDAAAIVLRSRINGGDASIATLAKFQCSPQQLLIPVVLSTSVGLTVQGAVSQSAYLTEWQNSDGTRAGAFGLGAAQPFVGDSGSFTTGYGSSIIGSGLNFNRSRGVYANASSGDFVFNMAASAVRTETDGDHSLGTAAKRWGPLYAIQGNFISNAGGTIPLLVKGAASRTATLLQLQTSAGASLGNVGGCIFDHYTDSATTHTDGTEDTLYTDTLAANTLAVNGDKVSVEYGGTFVSSATATRRLKVYFAGTVALDTGALTVSLSSAWTIYATFVRVSATVVRYMVSLATEGAALAAYTAVGEITGLTLTGTNIVKVTGIAAGTGAAASDITAKLGTLDWRSAA